MDYQLKAIGKLCHATGEPLAPGTECHSALVEQGGELVRLDFVATEWPGPPQGTVADWLCRVPDAEQETRAPLDPESLFELFEELLDEASPSREQLTYVLALLLIQKKRLRIEDSVRVDETDVLLLSGSHGEGPFELRDQDLSNSEIEKLQIELNAHLNPSSPHDQAA